MEEGRVQIGSRREGRQASRPGSREEEGQERGPGKRRLSVEQE